MMKLVFEKPGISSYDFQSFNIIGPDFDNFTTTQRAYLKVKEDVLFFDNCLGIQFGSSIDLLDENNETIVSLPRTFRPSVFYKLESNAWKNLVNKRRKKTPYLLPEDVMQKELTHYFFQFNEKKYWHILSNEVEILRGEVNVFMRNEFMKMSNSIFGT